MMLASASRIGFGCASLGSRVDRRAGLKALNAAFEKGINWFDVAPSYGNGYAEEIFADFARGRREQIYICTKCGINPARMNPVWSMLAPTARALSSIHPSFRNTVTSIRPAAVQIPLSGDLIVASLEASLRRLGTKYIDVLALHDPTPGDLGREDVRSALERIVVSGLARAAGIAGSLDAAEVSLQLELPIDLIQIANNPFQPQLARLANAIALAPRPIRVTTHSVFGPPGSMENLIKATRNYWEAEEILREAGYEPPIERGFRHAMIDFSLNSDAVGTVLFSMFAAEHRAFNIARANSADRGDPVRLFEAMRALGSR